MTDRNCGCHSHNGLLLSPEGLAQRELKLNALDAMGIRPYVDKVGSVSALTGLDDLYDFVTEDMTEEQYQRFHNGSS